MKNHYFAVHFKKQGPGRRTTIIAYFSDRLFQRTGLCDPAMYAVKIANARKPDGHHLYGVNVLTE